MNHNRRVFVTSIFAAWALVLLAYGLNVLTFAGNKIMPGGEWISLPAGIRLLIALTLGEAGLFGVMMGTWCVSAIHHTLAHPFQVFFCGVIGAVTPPMAFHVMRRYSSLDRSLAGLTPSGLLGLMVINAALGPLLRITLCIARGDHDYLPLKLGVMFAGDLVGTFVVVYTLKLMLHCVPVPKPPRSAR